MLILAFISFILNNSFGRIDPPFDSCGIYRVRGAVDCTSKFCDLVVHEGSFSERRIFIGNYRDIFQKFHRRALESDFLVRKLTPLKFELSGLPTPTLLSLGSSDFQFLEGKTCRR